MSILRVDNPTITGIRTSALRDKSLSWKARGMLAFLMSMPKANIKDIVDASSESYPSVKNVITELVKAGYIKKTGNKDFQITDDPGFPAEVWTPSDKTKLKKAEEPKEGSFQLRPYMDIWKEQYSGFFSATKCSSILKKVEQEIGKEKLIDAFKKYCKETEGQYASVHSFCAKPATWMKPAVDEKEIR